MNIYDITVLDTKENEVKLDKYKGKVLLVFNSASRCGYTNQYQGLESLYAKFQKKGLEILDFPSNQFLNQAPGSNEELASFCKMKFGTTFETFAKVDVNGKNEAKLFKFLKEQQPDDFPKEKVKLHEKILGKKGAIKWNFTKFLIDREGNVVKRFAPSFAPEEMISYIEELL